MSYPIPTSHSINSDDEAALKAAFRCEDPSPRCDLQANNVEMQNLQILLSHNDKMQLTPDPSSATSFTENCQFTHYSPCKGKGMSKYPFFSRGCSNLVTWLHRWLFRISGQILRQPFNHCQMYERSFVSTKHPCACGQVRPVSSEQMKNQEESQAERGWRRSQNFQSDGFLKICTKGLDRKTRSPAVKTRPEQCPARLAVKTEAASFAIYGGRLHRDSIAHEARNDQFRVLVPIWC